MRTACFGVPMNSIPRRVFHREIVMAMSAPSTVYQPIRLPDWAWQRAETKQLLAERDIAALFRLAQRYGNASQARIAAAVGISQGRVNEIIHGRRDVANLDVLRRIADGLHMPDEARMALGLAPVTLPGSLLGMSGEIAAVYPSQAVVADAIRDRAQRAGQLDVLAVRALGIMGLKDSILRPALISRAIPMRVRVLLLDPSCPVAARRAGEIGESVDAFTAGIRLSLVRMAELAAVHGIDLDLRLHTRLPVWRVIRLDDVLYVSAFDAAWEGHESTVYEIPQTPRGAFWAGFRRLFDDIWDNARPGSERHGDS